jgi:hypothetical protein
MTPPISLDDCVVWIGAACADIHSTPFTLVPYFRASVLSDPTLLDFILHNEDKL